MTSTQLQVAEVLYTEPPVRSTAGPDTLIPYTPPVIDLLPPSSDLETLRRTSGDRRIVRRWEPPHRRARAELAAEALDWMANAGVAFAALAAGGLTAFAMLMVGHLVG